MLSSVRRFFFGATWNSDKNFEDSWEGRTAAMARLIPAGSSVIEFGASRSKLQKYLVGGGEYFPTDISRRTGVAFVDLNCVTPERQPERTFDVAFLAGVLEYVDDIPNVARYLYSISRTVIVSYVSTDFVSSRLRRRAHGWVNHYSNYGFVTIFNEAGWRLESSRDYGEQRIYSFTRSF